MKLLSIAALAASVIAEENYYNDPRFRTADTALQSKYDESLRNASDATHALVHEIQQWQEVVHDSEGIKALGQKVVGDDFATKPPANALVLLHDAEMRSKAHMRETRHTAKVAARTIKHFARLVESAQRKEETISEGDYEGLFDHRENFAEGLEDQVENMADRGTNFIEESYDKVETQVRAARGPEGFSSDSGSAVSAGDSKAAKEEAQLEAELASDEKAFKDEGSASPKATMLAGQPGHIGLRMPLMPGVGLSGMLAAGAAFAYFRNRRDAEERPAHHPTYALLV